MAGTSPRKLAQLGEKTTTHIRISMGSNRPVSLRRTSVYPSDQGATISERRIQIRNETPAYSLVATESVDVFLPMSL